MSLKQTPSQTVGPFFAFSLTAPQYGYPLDAIASGELADEPVAGERIEIVGRVFDGNGVPIADAMVEVWQADSEGRYTHPADGRSSNQGFHGFGRFGTGTEPDNSFRFSTVKPGSVDGESGAAYQRHRLHARHAEPCLHAALLLRRDRRQCCRSGSAERAGGPPRELSSPGATRRRPHRSTASTSICRATMKRSSSTSSRSFYG